MVAQTSAFSLATAHRHSRSEFYWPTEVLNSKYKMVLEGKTKNGYLSKKKIAYVEARGQLVSYLHLVG